MSNCGSCGFNAFQLSLFCQIMEYAGVFAAQDFAAHSQELLLVDFGVDFCLTVDVFGISEHFEVGYFRSAVLIVGQFEIGGGEELVFHFLHFPFWHWLMAETVQFLPYGLLGCVDVNTFGRHAGNDELAGVDATRDVGIE